ncbi:MAG: choice-of-anchor Q domain-containing protein [Gemmatimonadales bacterium]
MSAFARRVGCVAPLTLLLTACGSSPTSPPPPPPPPPAAVTVSISPTTATLGAAGTQTFTATVTNAGNSGVTWSASGGTIVGTGSSVTYRAPATGGPQTVTATSAQDGTKSASAAVTVTPVAIALTPAATALFRGEATTIAAAVTGTDSTRVVWTTTCGTGTPTAGGFAYTAPATAGVCTVTATSGIDPATSTSVQLTVRRALLVNTSADTDDGSCSLTDCTLREAITAANTEPGADSIFVGQAAALRGTADRPALAAPMTITLGAALPAITGDLALIGTGIAETTIDVAGSASAIRRGFDVIDAVATIARLTVKNGWSTGGGGGIRATDGATLQLDSVRLNLNRAEQSDGGGLLVSGGSSATLLNTEVSANTATNGTLALRYGGGIGVGASSSLAMIGGRVTGNSVEDGWGGGIGAVEFNALTLTGTMITGNQATGLGSGAGIFGVGVQNAVRSRPAGTAAAGNGAVSITDAVIGGNFTGGDGGGIRFLDGVEATITNTGFVENGGSLGGGISLWNASATLVNTLLNGNEGANRGGGIQARGGSVLTMTGGSLDTNHGGNSGGGLDLDEASVASLTGVAIYQNRTEGSGGGVSVRGNAGLTLVDCPVTFNRSDQSGGGLAGLSTAARPIAITNGEFSDNESGELGGGIFLENAAQATVTGTTIADNQTGSDPGGGIAKTQQAALTLTASQITGNTGTTGGGLYLVGAGEALVDRSEISGNTATLSGGGVATDANTLITNSTISGNTAATRGGGVWSRSMPANRPSLVNVTISGNSSLTGGGVAGGGVLGQGGSVDLINATIVGNTATGSGAGLGAETGGVIQLISSLLSGNTVGAASQNCAAGAGLIASASHNLSDDATCTAFTTPTDKNNTAAGVAATLANNGGPTLTHALQAGSAAIDAGDPTECLAGDQRGFGRQGTCDIGAFEFGGVAPSGIAGLPAARAGAAPSATRGVTRRPLLRRVRTGPSGARPSPR